MRGRRRTEDAGGDVAKTALFAILIAGLLASGVAMVAAATTIDLGPRVGDILVFKPGARLPMDWEFSVSTPAAPDKTCSLRPDVMASRGGSLVVEERFMKSQTFLVHWAGSQTGPTGSDCGADADLVVQAADLQLLSNAVGGPGVEHSTFTRF